MIHVSLCHLQWSQYSRCILNILLCISMPFCLCLRCSTFLCFSAWIHRIFCLLSCMILSSLISIAIISVLWAFLTIIHYIALFDYVRHLSTSLSADSSMMTVPVEQYMMCLLPPLSNLILVTPSVCCSSKSNLP